MTRFAYVIGESPAEYLLNRLSPPEALAYCERCVRGPSERGPAFWRAVALEIQRLGDTRRRLRDSVAEHPDWTKADHARAIGVSRQRVHQLWPSENQHS